MKTLVLGLFCLGFATLSYAQREVKLEDVVIKPLNLSYLKAVTDESTPQLAKDMSREVARFDITETEVYDKNFEAYEVLFKEKGNSSGSIVATYNNEGKVISSFERFKDIELPPAVRNAIYKKYPGWTIHSDTYLVTYYANKQNIKKLYKLKLKKR